MPRTEPAGRVRGRLGVGFASAWRRLRGGLTASALGAARAWGSCLPSGTGEAAPGCFRAGAPTKCVCRVFTA